MSTKEEAVAGLRTLVVRVKSPAKVAVVMLHGHGMAPEDMAPFAESLGIPGVYYVPAGPHEVGGSGRAWWPIDEERRAAAMARGPRDLAEEHPAGAAAARRLLGAVMAEARHRHPGLPLGMVGFSQGGMLACDSVLRDRLPVAALALLSASRIAVDEWVPLAGRLAALPVLVSHGTRDPDLGFSAGEHLRDFCIGGGAEVTWVPFDGGHGTPLVVWRALRSFLRRVTP